ncbi:hypothetical protein M408DRAFT_325316 [Serendipita vermifera MAFF 305830]|uniref:Uncharacterized protein n=1 Tax=Serendipita vermifera MAFF 305830 TaxID=933852 RepID=A0A0C3BNV0_SERVB|nr:hypothetical protein M408DRAFT_326749 [Serendipita vermifera MAFF 305830]KIM33699.1 hypothetical protein M408DRAFT_325316 [Serendipita vermifera MAFF 305830]
MSDEPPSNPPDSATNTPPTPSSPQDPPPTQEPPTTSSPQDPPPNSSTVDPPTFQLGPTSPKF